MDDGVGGGVAALEPPDEAGGVVGDLVDGFEQGDEVRELGESLGARMWAMLS
ncbi:hypothetical protein [Thermocatellispora tengchongensis]|uniref:hypothetical protein n=1 Tax=Thermocatellispora tengchongensis TaxID=1073253 RepID=UPI00362725A6